MILTVTPNVAIDRTYVVDGVKIGAVHKVRRAIAQVGGKGVNVSRVLACLGAPTYVTGVFGSAGLSGAHEDLRAANLSSELFGVSGSPRQTITVTVESDDGSTTAFDEPGPTVTEPEWRGFEAHVAKLARSATWIVFAGSLPPGASQAGYARLIERATASGSASILDARGPALRAALAAGPAVAKLNRAELGETLGRRCESDAEVVGGAHELRSLGAGTVIVTLGAEGAIGADATGVWRVSHPSASGNPIGAGDAFTAGVAQSLLTQRPLAEALTEGAALALASLRAPTAGSVDLSDIKAARRQLTTQALSSGEDPT